MAGFDGRQERSTLSDLGAKELQKLAQAPDVEGQPVKPSQELTDLVTNIRMLSKGHIDQIIHQTWDISPLEYSLSNPFSNLSEDKDGTRHFTGATTTLFSSYYQRLYLTLKTNGDVDEEFDQNCKYPGNGIERNCQSSDTYHFHFDNRGK